MANLNIPFVLLQKETCEFSPAIATSHLIHHSRFNLRDGSESEETGQQQEGNLESDGPS